MSSESNMSDLIIKAKMLDGRIASSNFDLMLDGILYNAFVRCYHPELIGTYTEEFTDFPLPLATHKMPSGDWYYLCSRAFFESKGEDIVFFNKKQDLDLAANYLNDDRSKKDIGDARGRYKEYRIALLVKYTKEITWYAHGHAGEIKKLLSYIDAIGYKRNIGYGLVKEWIVEPYKKIQFDKSMRPIPDDNGNCIKRIRPPYHWYKHERKCSYDL